MVSITKEIYYEEISKAVFKDLKNKLLYKQRNHCMRVDFLPIPVMEHVCEKINNDAKLQAKQVEAYLLTDQAQKKYEIESGRLIELRNRLDFGVLLVFIPQGFTGAAEDSYDIHTFESYDLAGVFNRHKKELIASFSEKEQAIINLVFESSAVSKQSIENQIRYILALKNDECTYETVGGYLYYVNLIPDLKLNEEDVQARLLRNRECVDQLSNCLLYTSPSPRDGLLSRMPSSA